MNGLLPENRSSKQRAAVAFAAAVIVCVIVPVLEFMPTNHLEDSSTAVAVSQTLTFTWLLCFAIWVRSVAGKIGISLLTWMAGAYYGLIYLRIGYQLYMGTTFDARFAADALPDVPATIVRTLGWRIIPVLLALTGGVWLVQRLLKAVVEAWPVRGGVRLLLPLAVLSVLILMLPQRRLGYVEPVLIDLVEMSRGQTAMLPLWAEPVAAIDQQGNGQNLVFLHLESVNSAAGFGRMDGGELLPEAHYMPELQKLASKGVLIPYFWANGVQTVRALATVLCGAVGNLGGPLSFNLSLLQQDCLPTTLRKNAYTSLYFNGFSDQDFHNLRRFSDRIGFDQVLGPQILQAGDPIGEWGFEECTFYRRVFETLREQRPNPERLLIYIAVSRHHIPYRTDPTKTDVHPIENATTELDFYLNSLGEQDACLATFWDEYSVYAGDNSHLFVFGDHSVSLDLGLPSEYRGLHVTNFLTPLLYIAPGAVEREGHPADVPEQVVAGQADLAATSLELLGLGAGANSFASLLEGGEVENYEACQVLAQPYGEPAVMVIRGVDKYAYLVDERTILQWEIVDHVEERGPVVVKTDVSYDEFLSLYGCERYRHNLVKESSRMLSE